MLTVLAIVPPPFRDCLNIILLDFWAKIIKIDHPVNYPYLQHWKMHSNKLKYALYWFSNSWNSILILRKQNRFCPIKQPLTKLLLKLRHDRRVKISMVVESSMTPQPMMTPISAIYLIWEKINNSKVVFLFLHNHLRQCKFCYSCTHIQNKTSFTIPGTPIQYNTNFPIHEHPFDTMHVLVFLHTRAIQYQFPIIACTPSKGLCEGWYPIFLIFYHEQVNTSMLIT